ncbi:hypothetical protein, partial [Enterococcus faecium]|uniref:hypothetical protein n=1 Tax=Enterococcus faecium TaxID=1352 RepID=UPI001C9DD331
MARRHYLFAMDQRPRDKQAVAAGPSATGRQQAGAARGHPCRAPVLPEQRQGFSMPSPFALAAPDKGADRFSPSPTDPLDVLRDAVRALGLG